MRFIDLTGKRFGRWTVIKQGPYHTSPCGREFVTWECVCDCGNKKLKKTADLINGTSKSCGCLRADMLKGNTKRKTHGETKTVLYRVYNNMKTRCYNPNSQFYHCYGGRGISVCDEWKNDFEAFKKWAMANGYKRGLSIDRIDVNGNYCPENCRWATLDQQVNNRRTNHYITAFGETKTLTEWAKIANIDRKSLITRIEKGWSAEDAIAIPPRKHQRAEVRL